MVSGLPPASTSALQHDNDRAAITRSYLQLPVSKPQRCRDCRFYSELVSCSLRSLTPRHKSYHPYNEKNKARVREDEARAREEEERAERRAIEAVRPAICLLRSS